MQAIVKYAKACNGVVPNLILVSPASWRSLRAETRGLALHLSRLHSQRNGPAAIVVASVPVYALVDLPRSVVLCASKAWGIDTAEVAA